MEEECINNGCYLPPAESAPWLVYTHGNGRRKKFQTFCTVSSQHYFKSIPQLRGKIIVSSNDGWVILQDFDNLKMFTLWNPISSQVIHLPSLDLWEEDVAISSAVVSPLDLSVFVFGPGFAFSYRPCMDDHNNNTWVYHIYQKIIKNTWVYHITVLPGSLLAEVKQVFFCNGVMYGSVVTINHSRDLVIVEVNNYGKLTLRLLGVGCPHNTLLSYTYSESAFLPSQGRVYAIRICSRYRIPNGGLPFVCVWELNLDLVKWDRVNCLQDRAFFVAAKNSTWCYGSNDKSRGVKQNCVYFAPSASQPLSIKDVCSYNLEDESWTSFLPCPNIPTFSNAPTWIMPQSQRLGKDDGYKYHFVKVLGAICNLCQGLQEKHKEPPQNKSLEVSPGALSLTFDKQKQNAPDKQKQNAPLHKFILCKLPDDLIQLVAKRMHLFDYRNFLATRKEFRSIIPIPQCRANDSYPLLMLFESEKLQCTLMDPCRSDSLLISIPELFGGVIQIDSSKDGWLLIRNKKVVFLKFFNPFTGVIREYPHCWSYFSSVGFSSCPTSSDCVTVGIECLDTRIFIFYHLLEEGWNKCDFDGLSNGERFECFLSSPIYHKGAFYFLDIRGFLGVFRLENGQGYWDVYGKPQTPSENTLHSSHLVECGGELLSVFIGRMGKWVRVFRLNERNMMWVRVKSLGNHVLFVGTSSSYSVVAKEREMRSRIYLPIWCGRELVFYNLDTRKYSTHTGSESFENLDGMKMHVRCCWI